MHLPCFVCLVLLKRFFSPMAKIKLKCLPLVNCGSCDSIHLILKKHVIAMKSIRENGKKPLPVS